jgi:hypothetical protein
VWVEGLWPAFSARRLTQDLGIRYFYRSHNVEHRYMSSQARVARHWRDALALYIATVGLESFELSVLRNACWVFDVSDDDLKYWQTRGISHISQMLPLPGVTPAGQGGKTGEPSREVVFLGNLRTPNNIAGVEWLLREVRPIVDSARPGTRWTLAGSSPVPYIRQLVSETGALELLEDVADAGTLLCSARALVNPVRTGSGVMVKMLDMLMTDAPIVSSPQGLAGLPPELRASVRMESTAEGFARAIVEALRDSSVQGLHRARARSLLWANTGTQLLEELKRLCLQADSATATAS